MCVRDLPAAIPSSPAGRARPAGKQPAERSRGSVAFRRHEVTDTGERARASPAKAENYLEEDRLSFEGLDLCTECLTKIREKERGNVSINQKNWCKIC